jgi:hypothetical protein
LVTAGIRKPTGKRTLAEAPKQEIAARQVWFTVHFHLNESKRRKTYFRFKAKKNEFFRLFRISGGQETPPTMIRRKKNLSYSPRTGVAEQ